MLLLNGVSFYKDPNYKDNGVRSQPKKLSHSLIVFTAAIEV